MCVCWRSDLPRCSSVHQRLCVNTVLFQFAKAVASAEPVQTASESLGPHVVSFWSVCGSNKNPGGSVSVVNYTLRVRPQFWTPLWLWMNETRMICSQNCFTCRAYTPIRCYFKQFNIHIRPDALFSNIETFTLRQEFTHNFIHFFSCTHLRLVHTKNENFISIRLGH